MLQIIPIFDQFTACIYLGHIFKCSQTERKQTRLLSSSIQIGSRTILSFLLTEITIIFWLPLKVSKARKLYGPTLYSVKMFKSCILNLLIYSLWVLSLELGTFLEVWVSAILISSYVFQLILWPADTPRWLYFSWEKWK